jgi:hypothetical protein
LAVSFNPIVFVSLTIFVDRVGTVPVTHERGQRFRDLLKGFCLRDHGCVAQELHIPRRRDITLDIWGSEWSVMCRRCNSRRGDKTPEQWEIYKLRFDSAESSEG